MPHSFDRTVLSCTLSFALIVGMSGIASAADPTAAAAKRQDPSGPPNPSGAGHRPGPGSAGKPSTYSHGPGASLGESGAKPKRPTGQPPGQSASAAAQTNPGFTGSDERERRRRAKVGRNASPPSPDDPRIRADERRAKRELRRREVIATLGENTLEHPRVRTELQHHAWRLARLNRMLELADHAKNQQLTARIEKLRAAEMARHQRRLQALRRPADQPPAMASDIPLAHSSKPPILPSTDTSSAAKPESTTGGAR